MRIDPKYFNRFIGICAVITIFVIIYSTIRYTQNQVTDFENNTSAIQVDTLSFRSFSSQDSLHLHQLNNRPVVIHFWSTWSEKSKEVGGFLNKYSDNHSDLIVLAAVVRDSDEQVREYIQQTNYPFHFVEGTDLFHLLLVPGMPTQVFIDRNKKLFDTHVGNDTLAIGDKLNRLLADE